MTRHLRAELVLPVTIIAAAIMVGASEFMTTFEFTSGGEPQAVSLASERHSYALLILAAFTVAGMIYAIWTGMRAAAIGTAIIGVASLLLFLLLDLPDAGKAGPLGDDPAIYFADARADPDTGFWLEAVGTVVLGLATVAFATLSSAQLRVPAELMSSRRSRRTSEDDRGDRRAAGGEGLEADAPTERRERIRGRKLEPEGNREGGPDREEEGERERDSAPKLGPKPKPERDSKPEPDPKPARKRRFLPGGPKPGSDLEPKQRSARDPVHKPRPAAPARDARSTPSERPTRERTQSRVRTASEERAAARARLSEASSEAPAKANGKDPERPRRSLPDRLRRLLGNDG